MKRCLTWLLLLSATHALASGIDVADSSTQTPNTSSWQPAQTLAKNSASTTGEKPATPVGPSTDTPPPPAPPAGQTGQPTPDTPLPDAALNYARTQATPLPQDDVRALHQDLDGVQRSEGLAPVTAVPRISSLTVSLSPGASLPLVRVLPSFPATVTFADETGAPWPISAPPVNGNDKGFNVSWLPDTPVMVVQALRPYDTGTVTVYLKGLPVPVVISMSGGEPGNNAASQVTDSRLDLRIPRRGPGAAPLPVGRGKIALYNDTLQAFLDGVPPPEAHRLKTRGAVPDTAVWQMGDDLFIRSRSEIRDAFDQTLSSADGTHVFTLPLTPEVTFSVQGQTQTLSVSLE